MINRRFSELAAGPGGVLVFLLMAAALESLGDSCFQSSLHRSAGLTRGWYALAGGLALILYGVAVNVAPWPFAKLLGVYVVVFFILTQIVAWLRFHELPSRSMLIGGSLIIAGGAIIFWGRTA